MVYILLIFFVIGTIMGYIYYYVGNRLVKGESIFKPWFHCENCNHKLNWYEVIPVLSYIFLGGKCKKCRIKLTKEYILYELFTGLLFAGSYYFYGFSYQTIILLILLSLLVIIYITDFKHLIILDYPLIIAIIGILITLLCEFNYLYVVQFILRGIIIMLLFLIIKVIGDKLFKQESIGWGDVKLSFIAGLVLGFKLSLVFIVLAIFITLPYSLLLIITKKKFIVPFGPFLITSMCIVYLLSQEISNILNILLGV